MRTIEITRPAFLDEPALIGALDALSARAPAMIAGGAARDAVRGVAPRDFDIATPLPRTEAMDAIRAAGFSAFPSNRDRSSFIAAYPGTLELLEVSTLRTGDKPGAAGFVEEFEADARLRDFTMNALFLDAKGRIHDCVDGFEDARLGRVRFVGPAGDRLADDPIRAIRWLRYCAPSGTFPADDEAAVKAVVPRLATATRERLGEEFMRFLASGGLDSALAAANRIGLFDVLLPGADVARARRYAAAEPVHAAPELVLAALAAWTDDATAIAGDLSLGVAPRRVLEVVSRGIGAVREAIGSGDPKAVRLAVYKADPSGIVRDSFLRLVRADSPRLLPDAQWRLLTRDCLPSVHLTVPIARHDLAALGIPPGEAVQEVMEALTEAWVESDFGLTRDELVAMVTASLEDDATPLQAGTAS